MTTAVVSETQEELQQLVWLKPKSQSVHLTAVTET